MRFGDRTGWDIVLSGIRRVEEYSPGRIFRTFQLSHLLSPLETAARQYRYISPEILTSMRLDPSGAGRVWLEQVGELAGKPISDIIPRGLRFERGRLLLGRTGEDVLLSRAGVIRSPTGAVPQFQKAYARSLLRGPLPKGGGAAFSQQIRYLDELGRQQREIFMFTGGRSRLQAAGRYIAGYGTSLVERFNQLARSPHEVPILSSLIKKIPGLRDISFGVVPSSGLRTFGKLAIKFGLALPLAMMAYNTLDHYTRQAEFLDNTILAEGTTAAGATLWTKAQLGISYVAEALGGHSYREWQEEIAPGSTDFSKLLAFPLMGALGGMTLGYLQRASRIKELQRLGLPFEQAAAGSALLGPLFQQKLYGTEIAGATLAGIEGRTIDLVKELTERKLAGASGRIARRLPSFLGKIWTPSKLKTLGGAALGAALVLPFLPGALVPDKRPEELKALYEGREEIPIRRGKHWEFGKCNTAESLIKNGFYQAKRAEEINVGDLVIASDGTECPVKTVYTRQHCGPVYKITTNLNRNIQTGLTEAHIVPVIREKRGYDSVTQKSFWVKKQDRVPIEVPAKHLRVGDLVQIPVLQFPSNVKELDVLSLMKSFSVFTEGGKVYSATRNWSTKKLRKAGKYFIPRTLSLDRDLGLFFGYFLAEGSLSFHKDTPAFIETVHSVHEESIRDDVIRIAKERFGVEGTFRYKKTGPKVKEGCWIVRLCSSILAKLFRDLFYGQKYSAKDKCIPSLFFKTSEEFKLALIEGYQKGNGYIQDGRSYISGARESLISDVGTLLVSLGFFPSIPKKGITNYIKKDGSNSVKYTVDWRWEDRYKEGVQGFFRVDNRLYARIVSIETEDYDGLVYDFEVDHPDHLYQSGSFLVHNSPWEGQSIIRYQKHWYPRMLARAKEKAIWGEEEPSPFMKFWINNFTTELEEKFYYERPYPETAPAFYDVPLVGPLLAATIGRLVKPRQLMHVESWLREGSSGQPLYREMPLTFEEERLTELGEQEIGAPIPSLGLKGTIGEQHYRMCFTGDTKIRLSDGRQVSIQEIRPGELVWGHEGPQRVRRVFKRPRLVKENVKILKIRGSYREVKATEGHVVFALKTQYCGAKGYSCIPHGSHSSGHCKRCKRHPYKDYRPQWYKIKDLQSGDFLVQVLPKPGSRSKIYLPDILDMSKFGIEDGKISGFKISKDIACGEINTTSNFMEEDERFVYLYKEIISCEEFMRPVDFLYDLEVENTHIYYAEDCLVHNSEMVGLPGFVSTAIKEAITGTQDVFDQEVQLATAYDIAGYERTYWEEEYGGMFGLNELYRRLFPHRRRQIPRYNPIPNQFANVEWLPGAGERGPNPKVGDPFYTTPLGEERLPGPGYAVYHPELKGIAPSDYPSIYRYAILADVAPYTEKYDVARQQVRSDIAKGRLTQEQIEWFRTIQDQVKAKRERKEFTPYLYSDEKKTPIRELLAAANEKAKEPGEEPSWFERILGKYWEELAHNAELPIEHLTPVAPAHKLIHMRTAIEDYKKTQVYGTLSGFWGHPIRDFLRPTMTSAMAAAGFDEIPEEVQEKRSLQEYFDVLKWVKWSRVRRLAQASGDRETYEKADNKRRETLFGINPYTMNFEHLYRALPRSERDYFKAFSEANMEERSEIIKLLPENEQAFMMARWELADAQDMRKAIKQGLLSEEQVVASEEVLKDLYAKRETEGMPKTKELWAEYVSTRLRGESYADWYRRTYLLAEALDGRNLPGPDWVGYNPATSLEDILLKVVEKEGKSMYDYNLWPDRQRRVARRPFIEEAVEELEAGKLSPEEARRRIVQILNVNGIENPFITITERTGGTTEVDLRLEEDRSRDVRRLGRGGLN